MSHLDLPRPSSRPPPRLGEILRELQAHLERLRSGSAQERRLTYAGCIPLLSELDQLHVSPLPVRELKALTREAGWHLRSLAGLASPSNGSSDEQHASWARASLLQIARCAGLGDAAGGPAAAPRRRAPRA